MSLFKKAKKQSQIVTTDYKPKILDIHKIEDFAQALGDRTSKTFNQIIDPFVSDYSTSGLIVAFKHIFQTPSRRNLSHSILNAVRELAEYQKETGKFTAVEFVDLLETIYSSPNYLEYCKYFDDFQLQTILERVPDCCELILDSKLLLPLFSTYDITYLSFQPKTKSAFIRNIDFILNHLNPDYFECFSDYYKSILENYPEVEHIVLEHIMNKLIFQNEDNELLCDDVLEDIVIPMADSETQGFYFKVIREHFYDIFALLYAEDIEEFANILTERFNIPYEKVQNQLELYVTNYIDSWLTDDSNRGFDHDYAYLEALLCHVKCAPDIVFEKLPKLLSVYGLLFYRTLCRSMPMSPQLAEAVHYCYEFDTSK